MKKILIVFLLAALPMVFFAQQFYLGPTVMYKVNPQMIRTVVPELGDFAFGAEGRFTFIIFEAQAMTLYNLNRSFNTFLDIGLVLDAKLASFGVDVGPNFFINFMDESPEVVSFGFNAKAHVDLNLSIFKISAYYIILVESITVNNIEDSLNFGTLGLSLLIKM